jgi:hypothetical protein
MENELKIGESDIIIGHSSGACAAIRFAEKHPGTKFSFLLHRLPTPLSSFHLTHLRFLVSVITLFIHVFQIDVIPLLGCSMDKRGSNI